MEQIDDELLRDGILHCMYRDEVRFKLWLIAQVLRWDPMNHGAEDPSEW